MHRAQCPFPPNAAILARAHLPSHFSIIYKRVYQVSFVRLQVSLSARPLHPRMHCFACALGTRRTSRVRARPYLCMRFPFFCPSRGRKEVLVPLLKTHQRVSQLLGIVLQRSVRFMQPRNHDLPSLCRWGRSTMARRKKKTKTFPAKITLSAHVLCTHMTTQTRERLQPQHAQF